MATVNILIMVDVEGALTSNNLSDNIAMVDSNKHLGSNFEGTNELMTSLNIGDAIVWSVAAIDPGMSADIHSFSGQAVREHCINPVPSPLSNQAYECLFQPSGSSGKGTTLQYTVSLSFENKVMTFDPFLVVA